MDKIRVATKLPPEAAANPRLSATPFSYFFPFYLRSAGTDRNSSAWLIYAGKVSMQQYVCTDTHTYIHMHIQPYTYVFTCIYFPCMYMVCIFMCVHFIQIYTQIYSNKYIYEDIYVEPGGTQLPSGGEHGLEASTKDSHSISLLPSSPPQPTSCESLYLSKRRPPETPSQPTAHRRQGNCCTCQPRFRDGNLS